MLSMTPINLPPPNVKSFDGCRDRLQIFKTQIKSHGDLRIWNDKFTLFILRISHWTCCGLYGSIMTNYSNNTCDELFNALENFFCPPSLPQALAEFASFRILLISIYQAL